MWKQTEADSELYKRSDYDDPVALTKAAILERVESVEREGRVWLIVWVEEYIVPLPDGRHHPPANVLGTGARDDSAEAAESARRGLGDRKPLDSTAETKDPARSRVGGMKFGPGLRQFEKGMTFKKPSEREDLAGMWPE